MAVMIVELDRWRSVFAESIGLEADDICIKCNDDEVYDTDLCIGCLEESLEDEESFF
jgi:hypothetical protein